MAVSTIIYPVVPLPTTKKLITLIPPDGGWGWLVILGTAISNIFNQSMIALFSLVYGDKLEEMGHETQGAALVHSTNLFISNFGGPVAGAVVKLTSPRFTAVMGACFCTAGIFLSGFSTNIWHLAITYGVLLGLGQDFVSNSTYVAINSYFKKKKSLAVGLSNVGTNIGQMLMPHTVRYFLETYGFRGTCLLLSALSFHGVAGCLLIQPVERHMKKIVEEVTVDTTATNDVSQDQKNNMKTVFPNEERIANGIENSDCKDQNEDSNNKTKNKSSLLRKLYDLFGIELLADVKFINVIIGIGLSTTTVANFGLLYPLFLQNVAMMDKQQTANCMSAVAGADMVGRIIFPIFQDKYKIKARWMFIMASFWMIVIRQILAFQTDITVLLVMSVLYGFGRSINVYNKNIAISENCKLEQVPSAVGLGMLTMGLIALPVANLLGWIRDYTDSYIACITGHNVLFGLLIVIWLPDLLYSYFKSRKESKREAALNSKIQITKL